LLAIATLAAGAQTAIPTVTLNDGRQMPMLGFGTFSLQGDDATIAVETALRTGYRMIDDA